MFANGLPYLAIPGPSVMPDRVLRAMQRPAPNIYTGALHEMTHSLIPDLRAVAGTAGHAAIYIANGHGTWEAALANVVAEGDRVLALATGVFCKGWGEMAKGLGVGVDLVDFGDTASVDPAPVEDALRADGAGRIKAVLMVLVDTSTGVLSDVAAVRAAAPGAPAADFYGDGLVPLASALGEHPDPRYELGIPARARWIGTRLGHLELLSDPGVFAQVRRWLES